MELRTSCPDRLGAGSAPDRHGSMVPEAKILEVSWRLEVACGCVRRRGQDVAWQLCRLLSLTRVEPAQPCIECSHIFLTQHLVFQMPQGHAWGSTSSCSSVGKKVWAWERVSGSESFTSHLDHTLTPLDFSRGTNLHVSSVPPSRDSC